MKWQIIRYFYVLIKAKNVHSYCLKPLKVGGGSEKKVEILLKIVLHFIKVEIKTR